MKKKNKLKSEDKVILFILTVVAVITVAYSTYLYSNQTKEGIARGENNTRTAKVIDKSSPPKIPEISGVPISSEKGSLEIASTDFAEYCTSIVGTYNSTNGDCTWSKEGQEYTCKANNMLNGNCRYGIGIKKQDVAMIGFSNKPQAETAWNTILENWAIPVDSANHPRVYSFDSETQNWKINHTWNQDTYPELINHNRDHDNGFIALNYSSENKFLTYPADWSRASYDLNVNPGWNLINTNVSRSITIGEFFNRIDPSDNKNYLEKINTMWVYDLEDKDNNPETQYVLLYYYDTDNGVPVFPETEGFNLTPGMAFWLNAKEGFTFSAIPFPLCTLDQDAILDECTLQ